MIALNCFLCVYSLHLRFPVFSFLFEFSEHISVNTAELNVLEVSRKEAGNLNAVREALSCVLLAESFNKLIANKWHNLVCIIQAQSYDAEKVSDVAVVSFLENHSMPHHLHC